MFICLFIRILEPLHVHIIKAASALREISGTEKEFTRQIGLKFPWKLLWNGETAAASHLLI